MHARDELHHLVDALPKREIAAAKRFLEFLLSRKAENDPWVKFLENPPIDDEPLDEDDLEAIEAADKDIAEGRVKPWDQVKKGLGL